MLVLEALWKAVLEVSKTAQARAKNACPEPKSTHHLSPVLTFIVLDCSAICCALVHANFYGCLLSKAAACLLFGSCLGCGIDLFCFLLLEYCASCACYCKNIGGQCIEEQVVLNWNRTDSCQCKPRRNRSERKGQTQRVHFKLRCFWEEKKGSATNPVFPCVSHKQKRAVTSAKQKPLEG